MIYVANHKERANSFFEGKPFYRVIEIGNDPFNKTICELTVLKGFCENKYGNPRDDIFGLAHYRRYFESEDYHLLTEAEIREYLSQYDCIAPTALDQGMTINEHFLKYHGIIMKTAMERAFAEAQPQCIPVYNKIMNQRFFSPFNMFIASADFARDYWQWLEPILCKFQTYLQEAGMDLYRQAGFVAERLMGVYLAYRQYKIKYLQVRLVGGFDSEFNNSQFSPHLQELRALLKDKSVFLVDARTQLCEISQKYDVIAIRERIEREADPGAFLQAVGKLLTPGGKLLLFAENRLGLKYFMGEKDPYTHTVGDNLENYKDVYSREGRCYSKAELERFISAAGFSHCNVYSVLPDIQNPKFIISEGYQPKELMSYRYLPEYHDPSTVNFREHCVLDGIVDNKLLPGLANGLLLECSREALAPFCREMVLSTDRSDIHRIATCIRGDGIVEKIPLCPKAAGHLETLVDNHAFLRGNGVRTVEDSYSDGTYQCRYLDGVTANIYLKELFYENREAFIEKMDEWRDIIYKSSNHGFGDPGYAEDNPILLRGYVDLVPINAIYHEGQFVFFDQEFYYEHYPANVMLYRTIDMAYDMGAKMDEILPEQFFDDRYKMTNHLDELHALELEFVYKLRNEALLEQEIKAHRRDDAMILENRNRLNVSAREYEKLYINPLAGLAQKSLVAFGEKTEKFVRMYEDDYTFALVTDDARPLRDYAGRQDIRVVICSDNAHEKYTELLQMGFRDIAIYRENHVYPGRQASIPREEASEKKYHIGYIAGVFDLFHIGHLNLFRRAKAQCDYLIVGVVSDEGVRDFKRTEPVIPFAERIEIVRGCRYVDEAVRIPYYYRGTVEAFEKYHFDVQFSGSDYEDNAVWLRQKAYLEEHGATMVFLPYTKETNSTKIKQAIENL